MCSYVVRSLFICAFVLIPLVCAAPPLQLPCEPLNDILTILPRNGTGLNSSSTSTELRHSTGGITAWPGPESTETSTSTGIISSPTDLGNDIPPSQSSPPSSSEPDSTAIEPENATPSLSPPSVSSPSLPSPSPSSPLSPLPPSSFPPPPPPSAPSAPSLPSPFTFPTASSLASASAFPPGSLPASPSTSPSSLPSLTLLPSSSYPADSSPFVLSSPSSFPSSSSSSSSSPVTPSVTTTFTISIATLILTFVLHRGKLPAIAMHHA
ncbi:hypothetical protein DENSPDRAFT_909038 [Dentipellis sp. KUC8613]|nr:hypothetical protein DENSPDRAFT_909038 [Dentipellis sp. KUC8613]